MAIFLNGETTTLQKIFCFISYSIYIYQIELKEKCGEGYAFMRSESCCALGE